MKTPYSLRGLIGLTLCVQMIAYVAIFLGLPPLTASARPGGGSPTFPVAESGGPRRWEASIPLGPFSVANLRTGVLTTVIDFGGYDPIGPPVRFQLFHSSRQAQLDAPYLPGQSSTAFRLRNFSPGWSTTFSGTVEGSALDTIVIVVEDDQTRNVFSRVKGNPSVFLPSTGVYDRLLWDSGAQSWTLVRPSQFKRVFDSSGVLIKEIDTAGNELRIERTYADSWTIRPFVDGDPLGNGITIGWERIPFLGGQLTGRPSSIQFGSGDSRRTFFLNYGPRDWDEQDAIDIATDYLQNPAADPNQWLDWICYPYGGIGLGPPAYPYDQRVDFRYLSDGRIQTITDRDAMPEPEPGQPAGTGAFEPRKGRTWQYAYHGASHQVWKLIRPAPTGETPLEEEINYCVPSQFMDCPLPGDPLGGGGVPLGMQGEGPGGFGPQALSGGGGEAFAMTTYTDPYEQDWKVWHNDAGLLRYLQAPDPLALGFEGPITELRYGGGHNVEEQVDPLGRSWFTTYGPVGNVTSSTNPLGHTTSLNWLFVGSSPASNHYRLDSVTDPSGASVQYEYNSPVDPTLITKIIEPADGQGNPAAQTLLEYYEENRLFEPYEMNARGQLRRVIDANGVQTRFKYDEYGFTYEFFEGDYEGALPRGSAAPRVVNRGGSRRPTGEPVNAFDNTDGTLDPGTLVETTAVEHTEAGCLVKDIHRPFPIENVAPARFGASPTPELPTIDRELVGVDYPDAMRLFQRRARVPADTNRIWETHLDYWGQPIIHGVTSDEPGWAQSVSRTSYTIFDAAGRLLEASGPGDPAGKVRRYHYDAMGRLDRIDHFDTTTQSSTPIVEYFFDYASRITMSAAANGVAAEYSYDDADRITAIDHKSGVSSLARMEYDWNNRSLVTTRREFIGAVGAPSTLNATVDFAYDTRGRLIGEARTGSHAYDYAYSYDQLGNRLAKDETVNGVLKRTIYTYDITDPDSNFPTHNNRLMQYEIFGAPYDGSGNPTGLERTVRYTYYATGHTSNISVVDAGDPLTRDLAMYYDGADRLTLVLWSTWFEPIPGTVIGFAATKAREFRYDADGRERYYSREIDPAGLLDAPPMILHIDDAAMWTDYEGSACVNDIVADDATQELSVVRRYFDDGSEENFVSGVTQGRRWRHGDLIGSTILETDDQGQVVARRAYSAFGEALGAIGGSADIASRYGYAGDLGYEENLLTLEGATGTALITLMHLGERWYQSGIGRFLQRDLIGLVGGMNSYAYVDGSPVHMTDSLGLSPDYKFEQYYKRRDKMTQSDRDELDTGTACAIGAGCAVWAVVLVAPRVASPLARYIRFESHQIGGRSFGGTHARNFGRIFHCNIGKSHIILDPRVGWHVLKHSLKQAVRHVRDWF